MGIGPSGQGRRDTAEVASSRRVNMSFPELGHAAVSDLQPENAPYVPTYQNTAIVEEYFKHVNEERKRRLGDKARLLGLVGTVFPNMSYLARQPRSISVWHPRGPHKTEAWRWFLVDRDVPDEVKDILRHYYIRYSGPAGMTEQDDMENWGYAHAASRGTIARRHPYNYELGLGTGKPDQHFNGVATERINEENARGFYTRWSRVMEAKNWDELISDGHPPGAKKRANGAGGRR